jgi:hypothetical protein
MWEPYLKVTREKCSEALHILDGIEFSDQTGYLRIGFFLKIAENLPNSPR